MILFVLMDAIFWNCDISVLAEGNTCFFGFSQPVYGKDQFPHKISNGYRRNTFWVGVDCGVSQMKKPLRGSKIWGLSKWRSNLIFKRKKSPPKNFLKHCLLLRVFYFVVCSLHFPKKDKYHYLRLLNFVFSVAVSWGTSVKLLSWSRNCFTSIYFLSCREKDNIHF